VKMQKSATEDVKNAIAMQDVAIALHKETNKILADICNELKKDK